MAEIVVSAILPMLIEKLGSEAVERVVRAKGIHSELNKWESKLNLIKAVLNDASQQEIKKEAVKLWLNGLQHLAYDIDDILDDLATEAMEREFTEESGSITSKTQLRLEAFYSVNERLAKMHSEDWSNVKRQMKSLIR